MKKKRIEALPETEKAKAAHKQQMRAWKNRRPTKEEREWQLKKLKVLEKLAAKVPILETIFESLARFDLLLKGASKHAQRLEEARSVACANYFHLANLPTEIVVVRKHLATNNVQALFVHPKTLTKLTGQKCDSGSVGHWFGVRVLAHGVIRRGSVLCLQSVTPQLAPPSE